VQFVVFRPSGPKSEQYYTEMPLQITVNGGYHQIASFMAELANLRRIITVANVHLKANNTANLEYTTGADFTASAYSLNTTPSTPSAAPKKEGDSNVRKAS
jgi:Tfp pilus assembly protein PilO